MKKRQMQIIELLNQTGRLTVQDASDKLSVSLVTVRKDFKALEKAGLLARMHGFAMKSSSDDIASRLGVNYEKKKAYSLPRGGYSRFRRDHHDRVGFDLRTFCYGTRFIRKGCYYNNKFGVYRKVYTPSAAFKSHMGSIYFDIDSGFEHQKHRSLHPLKNMVVLIPGPS